MQAGLSAPIQGVSPLKGDGSLRGPSDSCDTRFWYLDPLQDEHHNSCQWQHHSHLSFFLQATMTKLKVTELEAFCNFKRARLSPV